MFTAEQLCLEDRRGRRSLQGEIKLPYEKSPLGVFAREDIRITENQWQKYCLRNFLSVRVNDTYYPVAAKSIIFTKSFQK